MERLEYILGWKKKIIKSVTLVFMVCALVCIIISCANIDIGMLCGAGITAVFVAMNTVVISTSESTFENASLDNVLAFYPFDKRQYFSYYAKKMLVVGLIMSVLVVLSGAIGHLSNIREMVVLTIFMILSVLYVLLCAFIAWHKAKSEEIDIASFYAVEVCLLIFLVAATLFIMSVLL